MQSFKKEFLLDPEVIFLNHGSFGATPKSVFKVYQKWQRRLENQPVIFLERELDNLLLQSRQALGIYLNADPENLVYIPNATHGVNILAKSLDLQPGDEILTTDHEYGACNYAWEYVCQKTGAVYIQQPIPLPIRTEEEITEQFWSGVSTRTKVIYLSHITSPTALQIPVETICRRACQAGILTIVDAAHSPGQIPVDLSAIDTDFVVGNCHKWMLAPKGAAFLYARQNVQHFVNPLIVSWGFHPTTDSSTGSRFIDLLQWTGTKDPAAALTVPAAIQFMQDHNWDSIRRTCHALLSQAIQRICELTAMAPLYPLTSDLYHQMGIAPLPNSIDLNLLKRRLYNEYRVEVPFIDWQNQKFIRISVQGYNTQDDINALINALAILLPQVSL